MMGGPGLRRVGIFGAVIAIALAPLAAAAQDIPIPKFPGVDTAKGPDDVVNTLEILFLLTVLSLAPALIMLTTAFTRIVIVLSFVRRALATNELPPNQVIVGLSLILTFLVMQPTFQKIKNEALTPYLEAKITQKTAFKNATEEMRRFMFAQTRAKDIRLFLQVAHTELPTDREPVKADVPTSVLVPSFVLSELRKSFVMGFAIFLPFVIIDLVVATTLISMGMLVLPPILISLPFKILLFVLIDGWHLIVGSIVTSFVSPT